MDSSASLTVNAVADEVNISVGNQNTVDLANTNIVFASDNFESGPNGWDTATSTSGNFNTGEMLGQLGNSNGQQGTFKTYDVPPGVNEIELSFTLHEITSWNDETFTIFINGEAYTATNLSYYGEPNGNDTGTTILSNSAGEQVGEIVHGTDGIRAGIGTLRVT